MSSTGAETPDPLPLSKLMELEAHREWWTPEIVRWLERQERFAAALASQAGAEPPPKTDVHLAVPDDEGKEPRFVALRAKGVIDADDNLDCWDTPPYDIAKRHVEALNKKDPLAMWRVAQLYVLPEPTQPKE